MTVATEQAGLKLLAYLSEHAARYHHRLWLDPRAVIRHLGISDQQFATDSAELVAHGLAGVRKFASDNVAVAASPWCAIWLTTKGEEYMRAMGAAAS